MRESARPCLYGKLICRRYVQTGAFVSRSRAAQSRCCAPWAIHSEHFEEPDSGTHKCDGDGCMQVSLPDQSPSLEGIDGSALSLRYHTLLLLDHYPQTRALDPTSALHICLKSSISIVRCPHHHMAKSSSCSRKLLGDTLPHVAWVGRNHTNSHVVPWSPEVLPPCPPTHEHHDSEESGNKAMDAPKRQLDLNSLHSFPEPCLSLGSVA
ncbi:uncharacterized protein MYCFIDRAFT_207477 [Pseudocercospora fijiensis CIRAD86]|uniref:Uncharacterized protein n=1 Tax=Pseudocercospora fijiensis (strain CIRAD86) TaxID=383855 RepID=M3B6V0_PSEFD|nr:uncharacterized protein MYCFIDRAFT_207477 [Pseudocercospora fijiensis CIRAD86]EME85063.1 hypothetical protein MYCFIDRAFT_207477 [Pseudocercospora fijiensis CIRAD86]